MNFETIKLDKVMIDCRDLDLLSSFYASLLGWTKGYVTDEVVIIGSPGSNVDIGFQKNPDYVPPVWPDKESEQQMMMHLDFSVENRDEMRQWVDYAISLGARKAEPQFSDMWTVMLDPECHPFCIEPRNPD
jgi:catechol-2,3-dioxygenase